ncbi:MAG: type II toxin-antitoxin system RelE/ParE family toxin [Devosia sp.]
MKVFFSDDALADLEEIGEYIAADSPRRARSFLRELRRRCLDLGATPLGYPLVPGRETACVRRRPHRAYSILYFVDAGRFVVIARILHGSRDYERILFPKG